jgi:hypothetical protein
MKWITIIFLMLSLGCKSHIPNEPDAPIIIEAEILNAQGGSKYSWYKIEIKKAPEDSSLEQGSKIQVARLSSSTQPGIDKIYSLNLDWYNPEKTEHGYVITELEEKLPTSD